jgi:lipoprotein NlpI
VADYTAAIEIDPKFQAAHFGRAEAYTKLGDSARAGQCYDLAAAAMPADPLVYNNRGTYNVQQGRLTPAIADFTKALELEPKFAMAALNRGYAYSQKQSWSEAEADYTYSLEVDPQLTLALRLLGNARVAQGKLPSAVEAYSKAVTIDPEDSENYAGRGFARFFSQDYAKAAADFSKTLQLKPETTMVVPWKYVAQVRSNQTDVAKQELQAFIKSLPKTPNWHVTVCQYLLGEINDEALMAMIKTTSDLKVQKQWLCEARFFQGVTATKPDIARSHYADCVKTQQIQLMAYLGAKLALAK